MFKLYAGIPQIHEVAAFLLYEKKGYTQSLIHSFKYKDCKKLATYLGRIASSYLKADNLFGETDLLVPVPLHPQKEKKRGYNQAEWIAKGVAAVYGKPVISDILYRKTASATQTKKSRYERHLNVETIFALHETKTFDHKHILLIDDVVTTGATSIACIEALTVVPGIKISILALSVVAIG
jgi:ComF family protein